MGKRRKETQCDYSFVVQKATEETYNAEKVKLENTQESPLNIEFDALEIDKISAACLTTPYKYIRKTHNKLNCLKLANIYEFSNNTIAGLSGNYNYFSITIGKS